MTRSFKTAGLLILCFSILIHYGFADIDSKTSKPKFDNTKMFGAKLNTTQRDVEQMTALMDAPLRDILWCGNSDQSILALTDKGSVYRTSDFGKTWTNLRSSVEKTQEGEARSIENMGEVSSMLQSPVDPSVFIFLGTDGLNWITEDCSVTVRAIKSMKNLKEFLFHPYEPSWILASRLTTCEDFIIESCKIYKELYITQDLGESWTFLADYVIQFAWGTPEKYFFERYIPLQRIVVAHHLEKSGDQDFHGLSVKTEIAYSDNLFKTKKTILEQGNKFLITKNHFFATHVDHTDSQKIKLYAGDSDVQTYKLQPVILPVEAQQSIYEGNLLEKAYTVLDATDGQVYLQINHEHERSGDIYISNSVHTYSLSLQNSARSPSGQSDFQKVEGLEGIVLANIYDTAEANIFPALAGVNNNRGSRLQELDEYKMTRVSFNKGSLWQPLRAPFYNAKGGLIKCETKESCHLHLHSASSTKYAPLYSTDNALGILLGVGNVGKYLSNKETESNTYLSRDAGRTWFEVLQGSHIFEIGDHGAIIVAAPDQVATTHIHYTWDQGLTWELLEVSDTPIFMSKILVEPSNTGLHFVVYGRTAPLSQEAMGVVISINFGSLNRRICLLPGRPDTAASDYENWTTHGMTSCYMGQQTTYIRRKRDSQCVNPEGLEQVYSYKLCECIEADWQCDFGYERTKSGTCEKKVGSFPSIEFSEECNSGYYFATQGYRKISGNQCLGGVNHEPIRVRCPESSFPVITILGLLWVVALIIGILVLLRKSQPIQLSKLINTIVIKLVRALLSARVPLVIAYEMDQSSFEPRRNDESANNNEISVQTSIQDLSNEPIPNDDQSEIMISIKKKEKEAEKAENPKPTDNSIVSIN